MIWIHNPRMTRLAPRPQMAVRVPYGFWYHRFLLFLLLQPKTDKFASFGGLFCRNLTPLEIPKREENKNNTVDQHREQEGNRAEHHLGVVGAHAQT